MERKDDFMSSADHVRASLTCLALLPQICICLQSALHTQQEVWMALGWLQAACIAWGRDQPQDSIPKLGKDLTIR